MRLDEMEHMPLEPVSQRKSRIGYFIVFILLFCFVATFIINPWISFLLTK